MSSLLIPDVQRDAGMTTQEYAYNRLRNAVMMGAMAPGTSLTFRGLAETLGLSPTPIREAVRRLSSENAIEVLGNRRLQVPHMTLGRFEELVELRVALETHAATRALPYFSDVAFAVMRGLDDEMDAALARYDLDALTRLNQRFHKGLYALNPDQTALPLIESVWLQLGPFQRQVLGHLRAHYQVDRHKEMLGALARRDLRALCKALRADICDGSIRLGRQVLAESAHV
ncbi:GntR family transcriptional regulator [Rhodobacteraceae bacterium]|nr:GntR family transcriptional regulator [Paracoccaceae bacterium]